MRLRFRLFRVILAALFRSKNLDFNEESILQFTVMPFDCVAKFVGNDRYHAFMDIGRIDLATRFGWWRVIVKNKWSPFVITVHIRYSSSLKMFQRFALRTRLIYWDKRYIWMEHIFECKGKTMATAISKNAAIGKTGLVATSLVFRLLNLDFQSSIGEDKVTLINEMEGYLRNIN